MCAQLADKSSFFVTSGSSPPNSGDASQEPPGDAPTVTVDVASLRAETPLPAPEEPQTLVDPYATLASDILKKMWTPRGLPVAENNAIVAHNKAVVGHAVECARNGLRVIRCNSLTTDETPECTCMRGRRQLAAERGEEVVPCASPGKHPIGAQWQKDATNDPTRMLPQWGKGGSRINVGIVFGPEDGIFVIDADGPDGLASVALLEDAGELPATLTQITGSGGEHRFYRGREGWQIKNSVSTASKKLDVRGENGFVVGPGSLHKSGNLYRWKEGHGLGEIAIADAPLDLLYRCYFASVANQTAPDGMTRAVWEASIGIPLHKPLGPAETALSSDPAHTPVATSSRPTLPDGQGVAGYCARFGDGDGKFGFHDPVNRAALCWLREREGRDPDIAGLTVALTEAIRAAPVEAGRTNTPESYIARLPEIIAEAQKLIDDTPNATPQKAPLIETLASGTALIEGLQEGEDSFPEASRIAWSIGASNLDGGEAEALRFKLHRKTKLPMRVINAQSKHGAAWKDEQKKKGKEKAKKRRTLEEALREMNAEYYLYKSGKDVLIGFEPRPGKIDTGLSEHAFLLMQRPIRALDTSLDEPRMVEVAPKWLEWEDRHFYRGGLVFEPPGSTNKVAPDQKNEWGGFPLKGKEGDWSMLRQHLKEHICGYTGQTDEEREGLFNYVLTYLSHIVQVPGRKPGSAILILGDEGSGKSTLFEMFKIILDDYYIKISQEKHLTGNFNAHQRNKVVIHVEETANTEKQSRAGILKDKVTSEEDVIEGKGRDAYSQSSYARLLVCTNNPDSFYISNKGDSRRWLYLRCSNAMTGKIEEFWEPLRKQMLEDGGVEAMLYDLERWIPEEHKGVDGRPLSWNSLRLPPKTWVLQDQINTGFDPSEEFFVTLIENGGKTSTLGDLPEIDLTGEHKTEVPVSLLRSHHDRYVKEHGGAFRYGKRHCFAVNSERFLKAHQNWSHEERIYYTAPIRALMLWAQLEGWIKGHSYVWFKATPEQLKAMREADGFSLIHDMERSGILAGLLEDGGCADWIKDARQAEDPIQKIKGYLEAATPLPPATVAPVATVTGVSSSPDSNVVALEPVKRKRF